MSVPIEKFIEEVNSASQRVRWGLSVLTIVSVVVFFNAWANGYGDWTEKKLDRAREVYRWWGTTNASDLKSRSYVQAKRFEAAVTNKRGAMDKDAWRTNIVAQFEEAHKSQHNHGAVSIAAFGITFDPNDLGLFSGITYLVVLVILRSCLARQLVNLKICLAKAEQYKCLQDSYPLLSMGQVLSIPPSEHYAKKELWGYVHKALYFLPILVHGVVVLYDLKTIEIGAAIDPLHAWTVLVSSGVFWMIIGFLVRECVMQSRLFDQEWNRAFEKWSSAGTGQKLQIPAENARSSLGIKGT
jgi:hypothetical protein